MKDEGENYFFLFYTFIYYFPFILSVICLGISIFPISLQILIVELVKSH
jgi:hypothetical protein